MFIMAAHLHKSKGECCIERGKQSTIASTWYKVMALIVMSQLMVQHCCGLFKVLKPCVPMLIKATTLWPLVSSIQFWLNSFTGFSPQNGDRHLLRFEYETGEYLSGLTPSSSCQEVGFCVIPPFAKLQDPQLFESLLLSSASRTSSWLPCCGNHV